MTTVNMHEAKSQLSSLVEKALAGEEVIIGKAGKPVAMLVPYRADTTPRQLGGTWSGKVKMADDFDTLPPELAEAFYGKSTP